MNREKIHRIIDLVIDIKEISKGKEGYPYVSIEVRNMYMQMRIHIMRNGFFEKSEWDFAEETADYMDEAEQNERLDITIKELEYCLKIVKEKANGTN